MELLEVRGLVVCGGEGGGVVAERSEDGGGEFFLWVYFLKDFSSSLLWEQRIWRENHA